MASQWYSLISQKIFLAKSLLDQHDNADAMPAREAIWQGATELSLRSRRLLLVMVARFHQQKQAEPATMEELSRLIGDEAAEIAELKALEADSASWWSYLGQLEQYLSRPVATKKTVSEENIIAVAADTGPDRSPAALASALKAFKHFIDVLEDRHSEW